MIIYYRISSNSYEKPRIPGANKKVCLENFLNIFSEFDIHIIKDNCNEKVEKEISKVLKRFPLIKQEKTELGNSGSFKYVYNKAIQNEPNEIIYFVEDDYLHHVNASKIIFEGLNVGDYTTLYDHPDKYTQAYNYGETSKVIRSKTHHWKHSISTTMTFASKVQTLIEDKDIWFKHCNGPHPNDHAAFYELDKKISVAIPGLAFHNDLSCFTLFPENKLPDIEKWVLDYLKNELVSQIYAYNDGDMEELMHKLLYGKEMEAIQNLICLEQILEMKKA
jgi:hypothetical protein